MAMRTRKSLVVALVAAILILVGSLQLSAVAVGSVVHTVTNLGGGVAKHSVAWTSSAGGVVSGSPFAVGRGWVLGIKFVPNTGGTQPTDQYDMTIVDTNSVDIVRGNGANLSNATATITAAPSICFFEGGTLDVVIANAGAAKTGTVIFYVGGQ